MHHRQSTRLPTWDYASGAYFVTLRTHARVFLFGGIADGEMRLNDAGRIAADEWVRSGEPRPWVTLDAFVVMPNHLHGIVLLQPPDELRERISRAQTAGPLHANRSLGSFIRGYKGAVTARINTMRGTPGMPLWRATIMSTSSATTTT